MPCRWTTVTEEEEKKEWDPERGEWKTIRVGVSRYVRLEGPVGPATMTTQTAMLSPAARLAALGLVYVAHSPRISINQLRKAVVRVFWNEERGYFAEARFTPESPPIYTALTPAQARNLEGPEPDPSLIAMVFDKREPVDA
jgi:hypothetical protein